MQDLSASARGGVTTLRLTARLGLAALGLAGGRLAARGRLAALRLAATPGATGGTAGGTAGLAAAAFCRLAANRGRITANGGRIAALRLAATVFAEQAGFGPVRVARKRQANHGHQHDHGGQNDSVHGELLCSKPQ